VGIQNVTWEWMDAGKLGVLPALIIEHELKDIFNASEWGLFLNCSLINPMPL
jgi:hypothetical protein